MCACGTLQLGNACTGTALVRPTILVIQYLDQVHVLKLLRKDNRLWA